MNQLATALVRLGNALYPLLTSFALAAGCAADDGGDPAAPDAGPGADPGGAPDAPPPRTGELDPRFGDGGVRPLPLGASYGAALVAHGDGLLACTTEVSDPAAWRVRVARFDAAGELDAGFGDGGIVTLEEPDGSAACRGLAVLADGSFVVSARQLGTVYGLAQRWASDGSAMLRNINFDRAVSRIGAAGDVFATAMRSGDDLRITRYSGDGVAGVAVGLMPDGLPARVFPREDGLLAIGALGPAGDQTWRVVRELSPGTLAPLAGATAPASAHAAQPMIDDTLADAIELPDGAVFAFGGAGTGAEVRVARFALTEPPVVEVEQHAHGGPSMALGATVDGLGRPIVVGRATAAGATVFGWARYAAGSATLDPKYATGGLAQAAPPSGQGELVAAARLGGAIYALGHYDVETTAPRLALVKIVE